MLSLTALKAASLEARKARDTVRATLLTTLYSEAAMIGKNANRETTDEEVEKLGRKFLKNAKMTLDARHSETVETEITILKEFFPESIVDWKSVADNLMAAEAEKTESLRTNPKIIGWFIGQIMQATKGSTNQTEVREYILSKL